MSQDREARDAQAAAEVEADVGMQQVAAVYAEALLGAAEATGETDSLLSELDSLVADVLDRYPQFEEILASKLISQDERSAILDRVLGGRASSVLLNFLKVVSRHDRLECLRAIHRQAHELYDQLRGRVEVRVSTAKPIAEDDLFVRVHSLPPPVGLVDCCLPDRDKLAVRMRRAPALPLRWRHHVHTASVYAPNL